MIKQIIIHPYNPCWPEMYEKEAGLIQQILGEHCLKIAHIGSTAVPGLCAKERLDILCTVDSLSNSLWLEKGGYTYRGEVNIPLRYFFSKRTNTPTVNLHVVEPGHGFIKINLCFRDYLRRHDDVRDAYAQLKKQILQDSTAHEKSKSGMPTYTFRKNEFIKEILEKAGYQETIINFCMHKAEWKAAKSFRQKYFFDKVPIADPYTWTFDHPDHVHLVLYKGSHVIGYAHIQLWPEQRAALRIIVIDETARDQGFGRQFLSIIETWLKTKDYKSIHTESSPEALQFYKKHEYIDMPFNDPDYYESDPSDTPLGKIL